MSRFRPSPFTAFVVVVATLIVLPLLLLTDHDPSYTCGAGALVEVIHPEFEMGAQFRREMAFDSGYACNRTARQQVMIAGGIVVAAGAAIVVVRRRKAKSPGGSPA